MRVYICDDDRKIACIIAEKVHKLYPEAPIRVFDSGDRLLSGIAERMPDIVLLDIQMPGMDGIKVARNMRDTGSGTVIIFITGVSDHVFDAFDVHAFHYLVKPVSDEKLKEVLADAMKSIGSGKQHNEPPKDRTIMIQSGGVHRRIKLNDLFFAEVFNRKIVLHTANGIVEYYGKLSELERMCGEGFFRTHRGFLVNLKHVEKYNATEVTLNGGSALIARKKYSAFVKTYLHFHKQT